MNTALAHVDETDLSRPINWVKTQRANAVIAAMKRRNFQAQYVEDRDAALQDTERRRFSVPRPYGRSSTGMNAGLQNRKLQVRVLSPLQGRGCTFGPERPCVLRTPQWMA